MSGTEISVRNRGMISAPRLDTPEPEHSALGTAAELAEIAHAFYEGYAGVTWMTPASMALHSVRMFRAIAAVGPETIVNTLVQHALSSENDGSRLGMVAAMRGLDATTTQALRSSLSREQQVCFDHAQRVADMNRNRSEGRYFNEASQIVLGILRNREDGMAAAVEGGWPDTNRDPHFQQGREQMLAALDAMPPAMRAQIVAAARQDKADGYNDAVAATIDQDAYRDNAHYRSGVEYARRHMPAAH